MNIEEYLKNSEEFEAKMKIKKEDVFGNDNSKGMIVADSEE